MSKYQEMDRINERSIETNDYVDFIKELNKDGYEASLIVTGDSMFPFLRHKRDIVYLKKIDVLKKGDIIFYQRKSGQYVLHRLVGIKDHGYYFRGDAQRFIEGPIERNQLIGNVSFVRRKGKVIYRNSIRWYWCYYLFRSYLFFRRRLK